MLTCLILIVAAGLSAEAVRASCRRRLLTPLRPVRRDFPADRDYELTAAPESA